ncbi:DUF2515 family protein [Neobacillus drentensis]|uniref:DUF2515 family protein n=1 Tax=Neobacillus drentensis TaxID=220684 RepID=UPI002FFFF715
MTQKTEKQKVLTTQESSLLEQIKLLTKKKNLNNVTRTKAYLDFYLANTEIHWAFLGHMVSRNGGWNMTDLKGEILSRLLSKKESEWFFAFLERGNWLIFQDVYPQFLLYQESRKKNKPFFYLFPFLGVSSFMETVWNYFWDHHDEYILTIGLVINEQNYLEKRVLQNPTYKKVFNSFEFKLQDILSFNHILFPCGKKQLIGQTLHHFEVLKERISLGIRLYKVLFQDEEILKKVKEWAVKHPHTGSRKDYWSDIFNEINEELPRSFYQLKLQACQLRPGTRKIYSPRLEHAWKNVTHEVAEQGDWLCDWHIADFLKQNDEKINGEIKKDYCKTLERLELTALAKKAVSKFYKNYIASKLFSSLIGILWALIHLTG